MKLNIDECVRNKFHQLKAKSTNSNQSDSEFLSFLIDHVENCVDTFKRIQPCGSMIHRCPECSYEAGERDGLCEHFQSAHNEEGSFSCTCGHNFSQLATFLLHYIDCPVAATDLVGSHTNLPPRKRRRTKNLPNASTKSSTDESDGAVSEHSHSYHHFAVIPVAGPSAEKPYGCPKCSKGFKSKSLLEQHMHLHYPPRYKCRWCGNLYRWPPVYYHHKQKCKKRPSHLNPDTSNRTVKSDASPLPLNNNTGFISAEQLSQAQNTLTQFMQFHMMTLPKPDPLSNGLAQPHSNHASSKGTFSLNCVCNKVFHLLPDYIEHTKVCSKFLSASSSLFGAFTHPVEQPLPTPVKPAPFSPSHLPDNSDLPSQTSHTTTTSTNGVFPCSICGKDFTSKLSLKQHVDGKHRAEGKYLCPICGKRYRWGASFYYHKKTCAASAITSNPATLVDNKPSELVATST